jgi:hypothetical protein
VSQEAAPAAETPDGASAPESPSTALLAHFQTLSRILSVRALLGLTLVGAIGLGAGVMIGPTVGRIVALAVYGLLTVIPMVVMEFKRPRP